MLEFRILGPFEVLERERVIALGGPRQRGLLAILVLRRGEVVTSDRLIDELWGERPPATATKTLQGYISHLRKALGSETLVTRGGGYVLAAEPEQIDAERFERLVADGRAALTGGDAAHARRLLGEALALWRGDALADLAYEPFAARDVARLEEARLAALEDRIEADLLAGRHRELASGELESLVARHPRRERLRGQLMLALYRSGRQAEALEVYRRGRRALDEELGLEPGPELRALEQRILDHDPALGAPPSAAPPRAPATPAPPARRRRSPPRAMAAVGLVLLAGAIAAAVAELTAGGAEIRASPNSVAAIDVASDRIDAVGPVGARPEAIAFGDGSLWVANLDDETVSRLDPATLVTERQISLPASPSGLAAATGAVWVSVPSPTGPSVALDRIDPQFDAIDQTVDIDNLVPGSVTPLAVQRRSLWVAPNAGPLARLDAETGRVEAKLDPNALPTALALGDGDEWITDGEAGDVVRVDPTGVITSFPAGDDPSGIAVDASGVWVTDAGDDDVVRLDPGSGAITTTIEVGDDPTGIAVGAGSVWVADSGDGTITRIDESSGTVLATIAVGGAPQAIVVHGGRAWVTVDARVLATAAAPASGETVRVVTEADVTSMDPALAYDAVAEQLLYAACAMLVTYPDRPGAAGDQLVPDVAQSLPTRSDGGRAYTFTIRPGFRFAGSGAAVTAQTFKATIERTLDPRMHSPYAHDYTDIVGVAAYMAGKARAVSGVIARANKLIIRLVAPAGDLPARMAQPAMCAVPENTPHNPAGVRDIPSAGPYTVAAWIPGQGVVLTRNPYYHGSRPRRPARIVLAVGVTPKRAVAEVEDGEADYADSGEVPRADTAALAARYGAHSPAARAGHQQYFASVGTQLDFFALNTHRPLFASARMRQAVNYAIDRDALAALGDEYDPYPERPTSIYLPPGIPGARKVAVYPDRPDLARARALAARPSTRTAVLLTCTAFPCPQQARIVQTDLAAIGIDVVIDEVPDSILYSTLSSRRPAFDLAWEGWIPDYLDPDAMLDGMLENPANLPTFVDRSTAAELAGALPLAGPERYLAYARLDVRIAREKAPLAAFGNLVVPDFFSARIGCQTYSDFFGMDLAALCIRRAPAAGRGHGAR